MILSQPSVIRSGVGNVVTTEVPQFGLCPLMVMAQGHPSRQHECSSERVDC